MNNLCYPQTWVWTQMDLTKSIILALITDPWGLKSWQKYSHISCSTAFIQLWWHLVDLSWTLWFLDWTRHGVGLEKPTFSQPHKYHLLLIPFGQLQRSGKLSFQKAWNSCAFCLLALWQMWRSGVKLDFNTAVLKVIKWKHLFMSLYTVAGHHLSSWTLF